MPDPQEIKSKKVLLVEGNDEEMFYRKLMATMPIAGSQFQILNFGGNEKLVPFLNALPLVTGWGSVTSLGIIRDAEGDAAAALTSVKHGLGAIGLPQPQASMNWVGTHPKVGIFLQPDGVNPGSIETMCIASVAHDSKLACVDAFIACVCGLSCPIPTNLDKAKVHAFLSVCRERVPHLGLGVERGYWDMSHSVWDSVKVFLTAFVS